MAFGEMITVQFVSKHGNKIKCKMACRTGGCTSTVKIKYRLIIVKATKLLAKTGIFLYICMYLPIRAHERR